MCAKAWKLEMALYIWKNHKSFHWADAQAVCNELM